jgi:hypothetical protein
MALASGPQGPLLSHTSGNGEEQAVVRLPADEYSPPEIEVLGGMEPRVVADFSGVTAWDGPAVLEVGSPLVLRIRVWLHRDEHRLRVVLDMAADPKDLLVTHTYEPENDALRALIILRPIGPR